MAEIVLTAKSPLSGYDVEIAACRLREVSDVALISVAVPLNGEDALKAALSSRFLLSYPDYGETKVHGETRAARLGPDQLMLFLPPNKEQETIQALEGVAYTTEQTGNWIICELSGSGSTAALERICPIDLHDESFPEGAFARTVMEHMNAAILRTGHETWWLMSASSSAKSFVHAIEMSIRYTTA